MKSNIPTSVAALLILALAGWGVTWLAQEEEGGAADDVVTTAPARERVSFQSVNPVQTLKKSRRNKGKNKLEQLKETGEWVGNMIKIKDTDGSDLLVYPEVIKGVGRFGKPIYLKAQVKNIPAVPKREAIIPRQEIWGHPLKNPRGVREARKAAKGDAPAGDQDNQAPDDQQGDAPEVLPPL